MMKKLHALAACLLAAVMLATITGCSTQSYVSPDEAKHIKGGPMPPEAAKAIAEHQAQWAKTHKAWSGPTPGAPGSASTGAAPSSIPGPPGIPGGSPPASGSGAGH